MLVAQVVDQLPHGLFRLDLEDVIERSANGNHPQIVVQRDQRLTHGVNDAFSVFAGGIFRDLCPFQVQTGFFQAVLNFTAHGDIFNGEENDTFFTLHPLDLAGIQQHDAPPDRRKIVLHLIVIKRRF